MKCSQPPAGPQRGADLGGCLIRQVGDNVAVEVAGDRDARMPEPLRHDLRVGPSRQEERGVRVPEIVKPCGRQPGRHPGGGLGPHPLLVEHGHLRAGSGQPAHLGSGRGRGPLHRLRQEGDEGAAHRPAGASHPESQLARFT
jgi:hypothetical protein